MTRKLSPTKRIEELFGTADKTKQVERLEGLIRQVQAPAMAVTVMFSKGEIEIGLISGAQVSPAQMKQVLQLGIDEITKAMVLYEKEAQEREQEMSEKGYEKVEELPEPAP